MIAGILIHSFPALINHQALKTIEAAHPLRKTAVPP